MKGAMFNGSRVTDVVGFHADRGEVQGAVRVVRQRVPERFRWRTAVAGINRVAGGLRGISRMRVEEPVRELVLDLSDGALRREVVLDARKLGVDLDRGEVLPRFTVGELRVLSFSYDVPLPHLARFAKLPADIAAPIDTAACIVVGRALSEFHRKKAHQLWLSVPDPDGPETIRKHHLYILERADRERLLADRWAAFAKNLIG
jgi:hypothetical protein